MIVDKVHYYAALLNLAIEGGLYMRIVYHAANGWTVDHHGKVSSYEDNDGRPFIICPPDRKIYIESINSTTVYGEADYPY